MYTKETAKKYTGTKTLLAWPMTRGEYNAYRGWTIPEDPDAAGYLVEYTDNPNTPNHPDHENYVSWSPANVFEGIYKLVPDETVHVGGDEADHVNKEPGELSFEGTPIVADAPRNPDKPGENRNATPVK